MHTAKALNLGVSFLLELGMLAALSYWGFTTHANTALSYVFGIGIPILVILLWSIFAAPKSPRRLAQPGLSIFTLTLFVIAAIALLQSGEVTLGILFMFTTIVNIILVLTWKQ